MSKDLPAVLAIVPISTDGWLNLNEIIRNHLGLEGLKKLFLEMRDEVVITSQGNNLEEIALTKGNRIQLPEKVLGKLVINDNSFVAIIERENAVAVKRFVIKEREAEKARIVDQETLTTLTRIVETNPMPDELLPKLKEQYKGFKLKYNSKTFLNNRQTFEAWKTRQILGVPEPTDNELRLKLIQERLKNQREDGSWNDSVTVTARNLRELADLGMTKHDEIIQKSISWLLNRPQSKFNPGMFFLKDELVTEQEQVISNRMQHKKGAKNRFREIRTSEQNLVRAADDLIINPCGPRIMWPNGIVMEALLKLGYEEDERVQIALRTMMTGHDWCECGYQLGLCSWRRKEPYSMEEIERIKETCKHQYRYGGLRSLEELKLWDVTHMRERQGRRLRTVHNKLADFDEYLLRMPIHFQGCEVVTTRAMSQVKDEKMRKFAEAHLWRFAGLQHLVDGEFENENKYNMGHSREGFLKIFASYDHIVSKVVIMRSLPWIIDSQNEDGSWGDEKTKDAATLAVITALKAINLA